MRFSEIKQRDDYSLVHLVTIEPTIIVDWFTAMDGGFYAEMEAPVANVWQDGSELASNYWEYEEATKRLIIKRSDAIYTKIVASVRFHFSSKPIVLPRFLEESPFTTVSGNLTVVDPIRNTLGQGAFFVIGTTVETSAYLGRDVTVKEVYLDDLGGKYYYVIEENEGTRWCDGATALGDFLDFGTATDTYFVGWPTPFTPIISAASGVSQTLDNENRSVPFDSNGKVTLYNDREFMGAKLTKYAWHNAKASVYWYAMESEAVDPELLYSGRAENVDFSEQRITVTITTDLVKTNTEFWNAYNLQMRYSEIPEAVVTDDVKSSVARTPYGRVDNFKVQSLNMNTSEGEEVGGTWVFTSGSPMVSVPNKAELTSIYPGDEIFIRSLNKVFTVESLGRRNYGITGSADFYLFNGTTYMDISCASADFSEVAAGDIVLLSPNGSFNIGAGTVTSVISTTTIRVTLEAGFYITSSIELKLNDLTIWKQGYIRLTENSDVSISTSDIGIIHKKTKHYMNRKYLVSPGSTVPPDNALISVSGNIAYLTEVDSLFVGDKLWFEDTTLKTIASVDKTTGGVTFDEGITGVSYPGNFRRLEVQSVRVASEAGTLTTVDEASVLEYALPTGGQLAFELLPSFRRRVYKVGGFGDINLRREKRFIIDEVMVLDGVPEEGQLAGANVGDIVTASDIEAVICEKINNFCYLAYPLKTDPNYTANAATWDTTEFVAGYLVEESSPIENNTDVFVDTYGARTFDGQATPIYTVKQMLEHTLQSMNVWDPSVEVDSDLAGLDNPNLISYAVPKAFGSKTGATVREVIDDISTMAHGVCHMTTIGGKYTITVTPINKKEAPSTLYDTDIVASPTIRIDFKGGPATINAKYRIGDGVFLERTRVNNEALALGNTSIAEKDLWFYDAAGADYWLSKELEMNTGARSILSFSCSAKNAPNFLDTVRCDFRNNPKTVRDGVESGYIEGKVTSRTHGADGVVYCEVDDLGALSEKQIESELIAYITANYMVSSSLAVRETGEPYDFSTRTVTNSCTSTSTVSVAKMNLDTYLIGYINYNGYVSVVISRRIGGKFVFGETLSISAGTNRSVSVCKFDESRAIVAFRRDATTKPYFCIISVDDMVIDNISQTTLSDYAAHFINCVKVSDDRVFFGWAANTTAAAGSYGRVAKIDRDNNVTLGTETLIGYGTNTSFEKLKSDTIVGAAYGASSSLKVSKITVSDLALSYTQETVTYGSGDHTSIRILRFSDSVGIIQHTNNGNAIVRYFTDDIFSGFVVPTDGTIVAHSGSVNATLVPYDELTGRFMSLSTGSSGDTFVKMVTWNGNELSADTAVPVGPSGSLFLAGVRVWG